MSRTPFQPDPSKWIDTAPRTKKGPTHRPLVGFQNSFATPPSSTKRGSPVQKTRLRNDDTPTVGYKQSKLGGYLDTPPTTTSEPRRKGLEKLRKPLTDDSHFSPSVSTKPVVQAANLRLRRFEKAAEDLGNDSDLGDFEGLDRTSSDEAGPSYRQVNDKERAASKSDSRGHAEASGMRGAGSRGLLHYNKSRTTSPDGDSQRTGRITRTPSLDVMNEEPVHSIPSVKGGTTVTQRARKAIRNFDSPSKHQGSARSSRLRSHSPTPDQHPPTPQRTPVRQEGPQSSSPDLRTPLPPEVMQTHRLLCGLKPKPEHTKSPARKRRSARKIQSPAESRTKVVAKNKENTGVPVSTRIPAKPLGPTKPSVQLSDDGAGRSRTALSRQQPNVQKLSSRSTASVAGPESPLRTKRITIVTSPDGVEELDANLDPNTSSPQAIAPTTPCVSKKAQALSPQIITSVRRSARISRVTSQLDPHIMTTPRKVKVRVSPHHKVTPPKSRTKSPYEVKMQDHEETLFAFPAPRQPVFVQEVGAAQPGRTWKPVQMEAETILTWSLGGGGSLGGSAGVGSGTQSRYFPPELAISQPQYESPLEMEVDEEHPQFFSRSGGGSQRTSTPHRPEPVPLQHSQTKCPSTLATLSPGTAKTESLPQTVPSQSFHMLLRSSPGQSSSNFVAYPVQPVQPLQEERIIKPRSPTSSPLSSPPLLTEPADAEPDADPKQKATPTRIPIPPMPLSKLGSVGHRSTNKATPKGGSGLSKWSTLDAGILSVPITTPSRPAPPQTVATSSKGKGKKRKVDDGDRESQTKLAAFGFQRDLHKGKRSRAERSFDKSWEEEKDLDLDGDDDTPVSKDDKQGNTTQATSGKPLQRVPEPPYHPSYREAGIRELKKRDQQTQGSSQADQARSVPPRTSDSQRKATGQTGAVGSSGTTVDLSSLSSSLSSSQPFPDVTRDWMEGIAERRLSEYGSYNDGPGSQDRSI